jgi:phenylalanine-4-hydroxylase
MKSNALSEIHTNIYDHPMVTQQVWENFTEEDHSTWKTLFERQEIVLKNRACDEIIEGMEKLNICNDKIPKMEDLNAILKKETGFSVVAVKGFIPEDLFFRFLRERKFPSTCFIRKPHQMDYLEEPDIFHDVFGHVPLLVNPIFADFMEEFGRKGLQSIECGLLKYAAALYWFTVEFGLIKTTNGLRIYGAGITSSKGESIYCLESEIPSRVKYNIFRTMKTNYHIDSFQKSYFVIENYEELFKSVRNLNWKEMQEALKQFPQIDQGIYVNELEKVT